MTPNKPALGGRSWLSPFIHLSNNWISLLGVVLVTTTTVLWLFLLPITLKGDVANPYIGLLAFLTIPGPFFGGLLLIPLGMWLKRKREGRTGVYPPDFPTLSWDNPELRKLAYFVTITTIVNIVIGSQLGYSAVNYMDSVTFCGETCHTVMQPEYTAYQNSPHSRVECVKCHIGPGAGWFVKSKLSGAGQLLAVTFNTYPRPIPTPVHNLRPARETCEACHWPQKYGEDRVRVISKFADDQTNSLTKTVLLMKIGGGNHGIGIHGTHLGPGVTIRYAATDAQRQNIPWVEYNGPARQTLYATADAKPNGGVGSTDVGDVSWVVPTVQARGATYAIGTPGHSWQLTAQGKMGAAHKGLVHVAKVMAGTALDVIRDETLLARAKADHQARVGKTPYVCPLPADLDPPIRMSA